MRNTCSKNVPCRKGITSRRRCGHNGLSCSECPTPPVLSIPESKGKANVSFLLVGEVPISMQQRYFISFQSDVQHLKPTDTSSPFLSPFSRHILVLFIINSAITPIWLRDYPSSSCWNLSLTCTLAHSHAHTKGGWVGGSLKKPLSSDIGAQ